MQILKIITTAAIICLSLVTTAQSVSNQESAFSESYNQEYLKNYDKAIELINKVYKSDQYEINLRLGWLYYLNKNLESSINYYQKAITQNPEAIEARLGIVMPMSFLQDVGPLLKQYKDILNLQPNNTLANYWVGIINYNKKDFKSAQPYFEKVVSLYPFDYDANHMLAWTLLNQKNNAEAKKYFETALLIRPGDASCIEGLSKIK